MNQAISVNRLLSFRISEKKQVGNALYIVMVMLLAASLLAIWAARGALFQEWLAGNDADYQRAFEAAQLLMQDAEMDLRGVTASGAPCLIDEKDGAICRRESSVGFSFDQRELPAMMEFLSSKPTGCVEGICRKRSGIQDFWLDKKSLLQMTDSAVAARYGQYTGATADPEMHPILAERGTATVAGELRGAWYWIEILPYAVENIRLLSSYEPNTAMARFSPDRNRPWIYRITVLARGKKKGTEVVLQSVLTIKSVE